MMKKVLILMFFSISLVFAQESVFHSILKNVSIPNVNEAVNSAENLQKNLEKENFTKLVKSWKKVEALYFAGDIDENYIDIPRYIDVYHNLKEDLPKQMQKVINSKDEASIALFKNSFRTINALEYVLFNDNKITPREELLAKEILNTIISNLEEIKEVYENYLKIKPKDEKWENAVIINTLIASTYRLKEWRIGEASGNASKYKDDVNNERAEYFLSKNSFSAIKAILEAHNQVMAAQKYLDFGKMAASTGAKDEVALVQNSIKKSFEELDKLKNDDFTNAKGLYNSAKDLHNAYYLSLIEQLSVTAKILDADGD
jgi:predicted lipoprotein